jgi:hypothetical protein
MIWRWMKYNSIELICFALIAAGLLIVGSIPGAD